MKIISTTELGGLPNVDDLKCLLQSMATLDSIITLDDGGNYDFRARWGKNEQVGIMDNGCGDSLFAYFNKHGCFLKGFAHESVMSPYQNADNQLWPGLLESVPSVFSAALNEPAFMIADTTFAVWCVTGDEVWQVGEIEYPSNTYGDGSAEMLSMLNPDPRTYTEWASENFELDVDYDCVKHVYAQLPLTNELVKTLNPNATIGKLNSCLIRIGYPNINAG